MKLVVIEVFVDKLTGEQYLPGRTIDIDDENRVKDLEARGLAQAVEARPAEAAKPKKTTRKKKE